jgi:hypothetical protein
MRHRHAERRIARPEGFDIEPARRSRKDAVPHEKDKIFQLNGVLTCLKTILPAAIPIKVSLGLRRFDIGEMDDLVGGLIPNLFEKFLDIASLG